jgi:AraC family transcriptional regulator, regulatory protein of adaptative response / DNA-3-methyladenine glycosylase II
LAFMELDPAVCRQALLSRDARFDGRFFVGVRTTGIYCRPICPARPPKAENCLFLPSAAAAQQAGFRPCLRCRPETAPELGAWRGTSNTVSRALTLIDAGALDTEGVDALADRLGIGGRQLRRLFMRHLGAAPLAVAQTRRVLLAKQLIHETDLSMAEVAHASGYGSVRRFNEIFQTLFGRPPASLRRARAAHIAADAPITLSLSYRPPYDWAAILGFFATRAIPGIEVVAGDVYHRTIELDGAVGTIAVAHQAERNRLRATICFPRVVALPTIIARLRRMFDLGADPAVIGAVLLQDRVLAPLVAARPGLRVPGAWDAFELGVRAIAGQQITVGAATKLTGRIVQQFGTPLADDAICAGLTHSFSPPSILADASLGFMPAARAGAIVGLAAAYAANPTLFERGADLDASVGNLCALPGIGPWTAHYIAMRALREPDAFPAADIGLLRAMDDGHGRPSPTELLARAEGWRPWRAYAALHLWTGGAAAISSQEATDALAA